MIVYHGSSQEVKMPDTEHSYHPLDFGKGFYVTTVYEQAERWARRKKSLLGVDAAIVNQYIFREDLVESFRLKTFEEDLEEWIDFVCQCRDGSLEYQKYDLIYGKVADDKVFRVVDMYKSGIWDKERALKEIKVYDTYDQLAMITQKAIDKLLLFDSSKEV